MVQMISRRKFLGGAGVALLASPFCNVFNGTAHAQTMGGPKRLMVFFSPNGIVPQMWRPQVDGSNFSFLADQSLAPLTAHKQDLIILDGLNFVTGNNHEGGMAAMLTNGTGASTNGMSIDQVVANHIGGQSRFKSLEFGVLTDPWGASIQTRMSYSGPGQLVHPNADPRSMYRRMFGDVSQDEQALENIRLRRRSVLDLVNNDLRDLQSRLGSVERIKLEQHLDAIRTVERGLFPENAGDCDTPTAPGAMDKDNYASVPQLMRSQIDLAVTALACDMTKVSSIQLSHEVSPVVFSWVGNTHGHHSLSHTADNDTQNLAQLLAAEQWCAGEYSYLIDRLKATPNPEGDGTLFDDTLCIWVKALGDSRAHVCQSVPFVIAGSAGGRFATNRYLDFEGAPHSKLLVSIAQSFGMDLNVFGDPVAGEGPLEGLA
jgi:hypothetical protein